MARLENLVGIYIITNSESRKVYVGSTVNLKRRLIIHRSRLRGGYHNNPYLQRAWNKHGEAAFEFGVLEYLEDPEELHLAEQWWMDLYQEEGWNLYNCGLAARSPMLGTHPSEETRRKLSRARKGRPCSEETRRKTSKALRGRTIPEKTRRKMGEARAGPYPAFIHKDTGEIIPAGHNLSALCRERGLHNGHMNAVKNGKQTRCHGWMLTK